MKKLKNNYFYLLRDFSFKFSSSNIALCKYWGKFNNKINIPVSNSISVSLGNAGSFVRIKNFFKKKHLVILNKNKVNDKNIFFKNIINFIMLFKLKNIFFKIEIILNIPIKAGIASSACIFSSLSKSIGDLLKLKLKLNILSNIARLGSGSASRSFWDGFVEWKFNHRNKVKSINKNLKINIKNFKIGLLIINYKKKDITSRKSMMITQLSSCFFSLWKLESNKSINLIKENLKFLNFNTLGLILESNALSMHALIFNSKLNITYFNKITIKIIKKIWILRKLGKKIYFSQDAGHNIKIFFLKKDINFIKKEFSKIKILHPFE